MDVEKDNISLNTQQLFAMPRYCTYKGPIVSLDQVVIKNVILSNIDVNTNRIPSSSTHSY